MKMQQSYYCGNVGPAAQVPQLLWESPLLESDALAGGQCQKTSLVRQNQEENPSDTMFRKENKQT
jgi:hypothetical protein